MLSYNFFRALTLDPGWIPFATNDMELKEMIEDLVEMRAFNGQMFCLNCLVRFRVVSAGARAYLYPVTGPSASPIKAFLRDEAMCGEV